MRMCVCEFVYMYIYLYLNIKCTTNQTTNNRDDRWNTDLFWITKWADNRFSEEFCCWFLI